MKPLDSGFNAAVLHIASKLFPMGYDVSPDAPSTLKALRAQLANNGRMVVFDGASDDTIFVDREVNYAFRAWHDFHHYRLNADFSPAGEANAAKAQTQDIAKLFGYTVQSVRWMNYIEAEVIGQSLYYARHKTYVALQRDFVLAYLENPSAALVANWS